MRWTDRRQISHRGARHACAHRAADALKRGVRALTTSPSTPLIPRAQLRPFKQIVIVRDGPNPTFDYYLASRLGGDVPTIVAELAEPDLLLDAALTDSLLLFCRYSSRRWLGRARRADVAGVALLIDDDYQALLYDPLVPLRYRWKLWRRGIAQWPHLEPLLGTLITSTPVLAQRYGGGAAVILPPVAGIADLGEPPVPESRPLLSYHATASHRRDQIWLAPILREVLAANLAVRLEVVADRHSARLWHGDPRITVLPQRKWIEYRRDTARRCAGILLAPLTATAANAARAPVKRIDAARSGAALIVSDAAMYRVSGEELALGMALPLEAGAWVRALVSLLIDDERRRALVAHNRAHVHAARKVAVTLGSVFGSAAPADHQGHSASI